jgi:hypothetical protein
VFVLLALGLTHCAAPPQVPSPVPVAVSDHWTPKNFEAKSADGVIQKWIDAIGGDARLRKLKYLHSEFKVFAGSSASWDLTTVERADGCLRYEGHVNAVFFMYGGRDARYGWYDRGPLGFGLIPAEEHKGLVWQDRCFQALKMAEIFPKRQLLPEETVDGTLCAVVSLVGHDGIEERWYFDFKKGWLRRVVRLESQSRATVDYDDYISVNEGVLVPYRVQHTNGEGATFYQRTKVVLFGRDVASDIAVPEAKLTEALKLKALLERYEAARGGEKACLAVSSRTFEATLEAVGSGTRTHLKVSQKSGGRVYMERKTPGLGRALAGFDGKEGWENSEIGGFHVLSQKEVGELTGMGSIGADPFLRQRFPMRKLIGRGEVHGRPATAVQLGTSSQIAGVFWFDDETAQLSRVDWDLSEEQKKSDGSTERMEYADYRQVDGVSVPFLIECFAREGKLSIKFDSVVHNPPLDDALFVAREDDEWLDEPDSKR